MTRRDESTGTGHFESTWRQRFQEFAFGHNDDAGIAGWASTGLDARVRRFKQLFESCRASGTWLDAGCGAGTYIRLIESSKIRVVGVDYSFPTIAKARDRSGEQSRYVVADVRHLPFRTGHFDGALCLGVLQALSEPDAALTELASQLGPAAELWVDGLNKWCVVHALDLARRKLKGRPIHLRYDSPRGVARTLRRLNFTRVRIHWMPIAPRRWAALQPLLQTRISRLLFRVVPLLGLTMSHAFIIEARRAEPGECRTSARPAERS